MTTMTPETVRAIRSSWSMIAPMADVAAVCFYDNLFDLDPSLRPLFSKTDMATQHQKLVAALMAVVSSLDDLSTIVPTLRSLGQKHLQYGVTGAHYDTVAIALLRTLEQALGDEFTPEVKAAWTVAYALIAGVMQDGADDETAAEAA
jgi:hemoglobin-like flavoprotein